MCYFITPKIPQSAFGDTVMVSLKVLKFNCVQYEFKGKPFKIILTVYPYEATPHPLTLAVDWSTNSPRVPIGQLP